MIIGLVGYAQTGKDTIADHLVSEYFFTRLAFADPIREAVLRLNPTVHSVGLYMDLQTALKSAGGDWEILKKDCSELRGLLQRMGTEVGREMFGQSVWVDKALEASSGLDRVVYSDVRFHDEAKAILDAGGRLWRVSRPGVGPVNDHKSDSEMDSYPASAFDLTIVNDSTKEELFSELEKTMAMLGVHNEY